MNHVKEQYKFFILKKIFNSSIENILKASYNNSKNTIDYNNS